MRVVAKRILREFWEKHTDSEDQLKTWYKEQVKLIGQARLILKMSIQKQAF
jgi:mRNA-degrading endonuclease HigB of HigAB toxin-antitoxin module